MKHTELLSINAVISNTSGQGLDPVLQETCYYTVIPQNGTQRPRIGVKVRSISLSMQPDHSIKTTKCCHHRNNESTSRIKPSHV